MQGTVISVNEVWHHVFKYPEVITNMSFVMIQTNFLKQEPESHYKTLTTRQTTIPLNLILMSLILPKNS